MATHAFVPDTDNPETLRKFIKNVSKEISRLSALLAKGVADLDALEGINGEAASDGCTSSEDETDFIYGDKIIVTNNYQGLEGRKGVVKRTTNNYVWIKLDGEKRTRKKKKSNVKLA